MIFPLFLITTATAQAIDMPHTYTTLNQTIVRSMQYLCLYLSTSIIISISIGLPTNTLAKTFNAAQVVEIIEGDALIVKTTDQQQLRVRIIGIDAPDKQQPHHQEAIIALKESIDSKALQLECTKTDRYRRHLCKAIVNGTDLALHMLETGAAWWFEQGANDLSANDQQRYAAAQHTAQKAKRGLWANPKPEAPWDWRARQTRKPFESMINPY
jgi:hypothetical protein